MANPVAPLVVIEGETASGKSSLAVYLAQKFNGEIICADSRTVYKGMNIGTAKPSAQERAAVPHHMLDISTPDMPITVADFKRVALLSIEDIHSRGKLPFLVGGTGLYIDSIIYDYSFADESANAQLRQELSNLSVDELQARVLAAGLELPENERNSRHLIRQIETGGNKGTKKQLRQNTLVMCMDLPRKDLAARVEKRVDQMLDSGLEHEARSLFGQYGMGGILSQTIGYQEFIPMLSNDQNIAQVRLAIIRASLHYAKRQRTWFRRQLSISRICKTEQAVDLLTTWLNNLYIR